ncbi:MULTISPECIES: hypothetical protein [Actinosynnema]|uniref:hypothetical protein n=1 Tax=Actinosynnema TaxID=40566 RepID=UPI0020A3B9CA|nr:hypothetical protein [Actinosynnema pretiosum]MCP2097874.1 hypothetical protein [Actinosynnema pretiosum]
MRAQEHDPAAPQGPRSRRGAVPIPGQLAPDAPWGRHDVLHLQRTLGNAAASRLVESRRQGSRAQASVPPVQRVPHQTLEAQVNQLDNLPAMWVPNEEFDQDGNVVGALPAAHAGRRGGNVVDALRVERKLSLPRVGGRRDRLVTTWEVEYQTSFFVYTVQLINDPSASTSGTLIDLEQPFQVVKRVPKGSKGVSMGRPYRFGDYWAVNPACQPDFGTLGRDKGMEELAKARGLKKEDQVDNAGHDWLVQLPSDPTQPFLFYTRGATDPNFTHRDGRRKDDRRFLLPADYDALAQQARTGGRTRDQVGVSMNPTVTRQDARRGTAAAMGGVQAHATMPDTGRGGGGGRLASHEWCHLIGDGDGGPSQFQNLVVGTNAVNTEQLAMETALRDFRQRMDGIGCAIRLNVEAILEQVEAQDVSGIPGGRYNKADWISFTIDVVDKDPSAGPVRDRPRKELVHRQVMDANRGTISELEFKSLHMQVRNQLRLTHERLKPQRAGSPMDVDG